MDPSPDTDLNRTGFLRWAATNFGANTTQTLLELYKVGSGQGLLPDYYHAAVDVVSDYMMWCPWVPMLPRSEHRCLLLPWWLRRWLVCPPQESTVRALALGQPRRQLDLRATTDTLSTTSWSVCAALTGSYGRQVFLFSEEPGVNGTDERGGVFHGAEIRFVFFAQDELVGWDEKALSLDMVSGIMPNV